MTYTPVNLLNLYTPPAAGLSSYATIYTNGERKLATELRPDAVTISRPFDSAGRVESGIQTSEGVPLVALSTEHLSEGSAPVLVGDEVTVFRIRTNANYRGGNVNICVRISDGSITFSNFAER